MVTLNGEAFAVYSLDTADTFRQRVAAEFGSLPLYIIFDPELGTADEKIVGSFGVVDVLEKIKESSEVTIDSIYEEYGRHFADATNLIKPWLAYNKVLDEPDMREVLELAASESIKNVDPEFDTYAFLKEKKKYKAELGEKIKNNKREAADLLTIFRTFQKIKGAEPTEFYTDVISLVIYLDLTDVSLLEIFNALSLTPAVPLASVRDFYKVYRNLKPPLDWSYSLPNAIYLQVSVSQSEEQAPFDNYHPAFISLEGEENRVAVRVDFSSERQRSTLKREQLVNRLLSTIKNYDFKKISEQEEKLKGVYYYPYQAVNKYIFADLVMNDPIFSIFLGIDEWSRATKAKPSVYFYFRDPQKPENNVSVVITNKVMARMDPEHKLLDEELFPPDSPYLRVRISNAKNYVSVENFTDVFSKLLQIYNQKEEEMLKFYRRFIPDFAEVGKGRAKSASRNRLKDVAPDVFLPRYTKKCKDRPEIVSKDEALSKPEGDWMLFPATPQEGKQHYYVCPHKDRKYPGLLKNTLKNRDQFPYLPCCYIKNQRVLKNSNYQRYFSEGEEEEGEKTQQTIFLTGKMATTSGFGTLPPTLEYLFGLIDTNSVYYRKGVSRSEGSFLECILEALHGETKFLIPPKDGNLSNKVRQVRVNKVRKEISKWEFLSVGRQELYFSNAGEIARDVSDAKVYLDPKKYVRILESYFNCNIFLFNRDNISGQMALPQFSQAYLRYSLRDRPTVLVYEHWGGRSESLAYPQCEIIVRWDRRQEYPTYFLGAGEPAARELNQILERLRKVYNFKEVPQVSLPGLDKLDLKSQVIDSYGKTRLINLNYEGTLYSVITEPIPPLTLKEEVLRFNMWPAKEAVRFVGEVGARIIKQNIYKESLAEIYAKYGTVEIVLPIGGGDRLKNTEVVSRVPFATSGGVSNFLRYNYLKKTARYLTEYFVYFFSVYIGEKNITEVTSEVLEDFVNEKVIVIEDYAYGSVDRNFSLSSSVFQGGKLVAPSEEAVRRLLYVLRLKLQRQFFEVINYRGYRNIKNYYVDITDFDVGPEQIILQGRDSLQKWIENPETLNVLRHEVTSEPNQTYFFKNDAAGGGVYLAQNVETAREGVTVGRTWASKNYNPVTAEADGEGLAFKLGSFVSKNEIKEYSVRGKQNSYGLRLLGFKKNNENKFTALLPLTDE